MPRRGRDGILRGGPPPAWPFKKDFRRTVLCGSCENCKKLERVRARVLACANPPHSHADDGVVNLWNEELKRLPCTNGDG